MFTDFITLLGIVTTIVCAGIRCAGVGAAFHPADAIITGCKFIARAIFNSSFFSYDLWEVFHDRIIAVIYAVAPCFIGSHVRTGV